MENYKRFTTTLKTVYRFAVTTFGIALSSSIRSTIKFIIGFTASLSAIVSASQNLRMYAVGIFASIKLSLSIDQNINFYTDFGAILRLYQKVVVGLSTAMSISFIESLRQKASSSFSSGIGFVATIVAGVFNTLGDFDPETLGTLDVLTLGEMDVTEI